MPSMVKAFDLCHAEPAHDRFGQPLAARAVELKCAGQRRTDVRLESVAQTTTRAMHARLHGLGADAQQFRRFIDGQPLDHPRDEREPEIVGQVVNQSLEQLSCFTVGHAALRILPNGC